MRNDRHAPRRPVHGGAHGAGDEIQARVVRVPRKAGLEPCVWTDCSLGFLEDRLDLAVIRFSVGFVKELKSGPIFEQRLLFPDGSRYKFAHALCAYDAGVRHTELSMEFCTLAGCNENFKCTRGSGEVDYEGLYVPRKKVEWGCEPEGCVFVEHGWFQSRKNGRFLSFQPEQYGSVHWACALSKWDWDGIAAGPRCERTSLRVDEDWNVGT